MAHLRRARHEEGLSRARLNHTGQWVIIKREAFMNTLEAIFTRSSYRSGYLPESVPREELETIMRAGLAAPSGCNKQTVSLIAVDDPTLLRSLREAVPYAVGNTAPALILVLTKRVCAYRNQCFSTQDYAAAIENMLLAIVELGYQSCWVEGYITDSDQLGRKMADMLNVPQEYEAVCFLPVGRAKDEATRVAKKPFGERAWFNGFGDGNS
jgi:nitroreductase